MVLALKVNLILVQHLIKCWKKITGFHMDIKVIINCQMALILQNIDAKNSIEELKKIN